LNELLQVAQITRLWLAKENGYNENKLRHCFTGLQDFYQKNKVKQKSGGLRSPANLRDTRFASGSFSIKGMSALTFFAYFVWLSKKNMLGIGDNVPNKNTDENCMFTEI
jgi:hypothetical protein